MSERGAFGYALRSAYAPAPYEGGMSRYGPAGGTSIGDLIGRQGQLQGMQARQSADMWGQAFQQGLAGLGQYFAEKDATKKENARNQATMAAIDSWDGQDPVALFKTMQEVRGPQDALQYTNAILALKKGPQKDPAQELARGGQAAQLWDKLPEDAKAKYWPTFRQSFGSMAGNLGLPMPEQYSPEVNPVIGAIGQQFGPKQESKLHAVGGAIYDEGTGQFKVPPKEEKPQKFGTLPGGGI